jgi:hypothetical protein
MAYANVIEGINRRLKVIEHQIEESEKRAGTKNKMRTKKACPKG